MREVFKEGGRGRIGQCRGEDMMKGGMMEGNGYLCGPAVGRGSYASIGTDGTYHGGNAQQGHQID